MLDRKKRIIIAIALIGSCCLTSLGLAIAKMYVGLRSNSIVITLDGMNSFFDVATGVVSVIAFCLLFRPRTEAHPFGFGRGEYVAGFVVSAATVVMGVVFLFRSLTRMAMPEPVYYRLSSMIIISVALVVKIGMTVAYAVVNRRLDSQAVRALTLDSIMDVGATATSVVSFTLSQRFNYAVDAWLGIVVSVVVMVVGIKLVVDNLRLVVGGGRTSDEKQRIQDTLAATPGVQQVVMVVLADYGYRHLDGYAEVVFDTALSSVEVAAIGQRIAEVYEPDGIYLRLVAVPHETQ